MCQYYIIFSLVVRWFGGWVVGRFAYTSPSDRRVLTKDYTDYTEGFFSHKEQENVEKKIPFSNSNSNSNKSQTLRANKGV